MVRVIVPFVSLAASLTAVIVSRPDRLTPSRASP